MVTSAVSIGLAALMVQTASAAYTLVDKYDSTNFFNAFDFFSDPDPTKGFVNYLPATAANNNSVLAGYAAAEHPDASDTIYMGVDFATHDPTSPGRDSIRVHSQKTYTKGLFIADVKHMPGSICGVWPAFWTFGDNWPLQGEIDVLEGVNDQQTNKITLHTGPGCTMKPAGSLKTSMLVDPNCNAGNAFQGCGFDTVDTAGYGDGFNRIGGGIYALEWTSDFIRVFFFPRHSIPSDLSSAASVPDPSSWGNPVAAFSGDGCDIDAHFQEHRIVFDTTFCGEWAGNVWQTIGECKATGMSCVDYVRGNPEVYKEAFWELYGVRVYQEVGK